MTLSQVLRYGVMQVVASVVRRTANSMWNLWQFFFSLAGISCPKFVSI